MKDLPGITYLGIVYLGIADLSNRREFFKPFYGSLPKVIIDHFFSLV